MPNILKPYQRSHISSETIFTSSRSKSTKSKFKIIQRLKITPLINSSTGKYVLGSCKKILFTCHPVSSSKSLKNNSKSFSPASSMQDKRPMLTKSFVQSIIKFKNLPTLWFKIRIKKIPKIERSPNASIQWRKSASKTFSAWFSLHSNPPILKIKTESRSTFTNKTINYLTKDNLKLKKMKHIRKRRIKININFKTKKNKEKINWFYNPDQIWMISFKRMIPLCLQELKKVFLTSSSNSPSFLKQFSIWKISNNKNQKNSRD